VQVAAEPMEEGVETMVTPAMETIMAQETITAAETEAAEQMEEMANLKKGIKLYTFLPKSIGDFRCFFILRSLSICVVGHQHSRFKPIKLYS
jgi:hypothetical protein